MILKNISHKKPNLSNSCQAATEVGISHATRAALSAPPYSRNVFSRGDHNNFNDVPHLMEGERLEF